MKHGNDSPASEVVPWWLFVAVGAAAAGAIYAATTGAHWLWWLLLGVALLVPRIWWRHLRRRWARNG